MTLDWISQPKLVPRVALIIGLIVVIAGMMQVNLALLGWLSDNPFAHWIYFAAGARLVAIMLFGWPAVVAAIAAFFVVIFPTSAESLGWHVVLAIGATKALGIWFALWTYGVATGVRYPWDAITWVHIPFIALLTSGLSAISAFSTRAWLTGTGADTLIRDATVSTLGDILGIVIFIALMIQIRRAYRRSSSGLNDKWV